MRNLKAIVITLAAALLLTLLPMPAWAIWARPAWVLLVLIYWVMMTPSQVNIGVAWSTGLLLDLLTGTLLGEHALALTIVVYMVCRLRMRINMYPLLQQSFSILVFVSTYQLILYAVQGSIGNAPHTHLYWLSSLTSMLLWPWLYSVMKDYSRWFRIVMAE